MKRIIKTSSRDCGRAARRWLLGALALGVCGAAVAVAQYQVNRQIYGNTSSSVKYGRSYQPNYANNPTYNLLPSENRNLLYRSGALPSTIRMNYAAVGPLAPQGVTAYVPQPQNFRSSAVAQGNYVNTRSPAYVTPTPAQRGPSVPTPGQRAPAVPNPGQRAPAMPNPAPRGPGVANMPSPAAAGSIRYAIPPPSGIPVGGFSISNSLPPAPVSYSQMVSGAPVNWTPQTGSVKFSQ